MAQTKKDITHLENSSVMVRREVNDLTSQLQTTELSKYKNSLIEWLAQNRVISVTDEPEIKKKMCILIFNSV